VGLVSPAQAIGVVARASWSLIVLGGVEQRIVAGGYEEVIKRMLINQKAEQPHWTIVEDS